MWKAGGIGAAVGLVVALLFTLITPICDPFWALVLGFGAGLLAAFWERPVASGAGAQIGAQVGALTGGGILLGQMIGAVLNGLIVGPEQAARLIRRFGVPFRYEHPAQYWAYLLGGNCCCALVNVLLAAGLGALGGLLGYQFWGKTASTAKPEHLQ
ncbi:MAG: hypothetical protein RMK65_02325 [Anaerolineae bacterium]|nr:hypothetical protein [Anaerolineae bacterium]MCX8066350.1 hypothetical protein [Anaerolineae bacterium]MDW7990978.1 hypothetical protein [Anaerolineae bacterium]